MFVYGIVGWLVDLICIRFIYRYIDRFCDFVIWRVQGLNLEFGIWNLEGKRERGKRGKRGKRGILIMGSEWKLKLKVEIGMEVESWEGKKGKG